MDPLETPPPTTTTDDQDPQAPETTDLVPAPRNARGVRISEETRQALCRAILAKQEPWYAVCDRLGVSKKTYYHYARELEEVVDTARIAKGEKRRIMREKMEERLEWLTGVAKEGVEMAKARTVEIKDRDGTTVTTATVPDLEAMKMFMEDLRSTVGAMGDLYELTGAGARNRTTRVLAKEKARNDLQVAKIEAAGVAQSGDRTKIDVFVMPKAPGVLPAVSPVPVPQAQIQAPEPVIDAEVEES